MLQIVTISLFPLLMVFSALSDLFTMTISNRVSLILLVGFVPIALAAGLSGQELAMHIACGLGVLVLTFTFFALGWIGGGDAKLAAATAVWLGFDHLADYGLDAAFIGGMLTLTILYARSLPLPRFAIGVHWMERLHDRATGIPYGIALAVAGLVLYPETRVWSAALVV